MGELNYLNFPGGHLVGLVDAKTDRYPSGPPFDPPDAYPELPKPVPVSEDGKIYSALRELFRLLELDIEHFGTSLWNPLKDFIAPGQTVFIKPNFVLDFNYAGRGVMGMITHGAVMRPIIDYAALALRGDGRIIIGDAPMHMANFKQICEMTGVSAMLDILNRRGVSVDLIDLRSEEALIEGGIVTKRTALPGDPLGYVSFDLGAQSAHHGLQCMERIRGADYDAEETGAHHNNEHHQYLISRTLLESDCTINVPKLKTHAKSGITVCLKNMIGINGDKNWLPHYRFGLPEDGGDECFSSGSMNRMESHLRDFIKRKLYNNPALHSIIQKILPFHRWVRDRSGIGSIRNGAWYGNDTLWRTIIDINRIAFFGTSEGKLETQPQRKFFSVVDGIIAGEANGPVMPQERPCGILMAGFDPVAVDWVASRLMGFDYRKIPHLLQAILPTPHALSKVDPDAIVCKNNMYNWEAIFKEAKGALLGFKPPDGWRGHIEV